MRYDIMDIKFTMLAEHFVYGGRWLLAPMYVGLVFAVGLYVWKFLVCLWELMIGFGTITEERLLIGVLNLVDITMVGNLIVMVMMGGWHIFVRVFGEHERPQWLVHIDSGILKIKMGMSLVGVSSIHLLKAFIHSGQWDWTELGKIIAIHLVFVLSTLVMSIIHRIQHPTGGPHEAHHA